MNAFLRQVALGAAIVLAHHLCAAQQAMCGIGQPPGSPGFDDWNKKVEQQRRDLGYLLVCDSNFEQYRFEDQIAEDNTVRRLAFAPRDLDGSAFGKMQFLGSLADGFGDRGAAMYRRVFKGPDGEVITLLEFSLRNDAGVTRMRNDGLLRIRDAEAQLTIVQATSGKGITLLAWQEDATYIEVTIDRGADDGRSKEHLIRLAESLPKVR